MSKKDSINLPELRKQQKTEKILKQMEAILETDDVYRMAKAGEVANKHLEKLDTDIERFSFVDHAVDELKIPKKYFNLKVKDDTSRPDKFKLPLSVDVNDFLERGYYAIEQGSDIGLYARMGETYSTLQVSNCLINPLYHINSLTENRRIAEIKNINSTFLIEFPTKALINLSLFKEIILEKGNFYINGPTNTLNRIVIDLLDGFKEAKELIRLGWQKNGFFAYCNALYDGHKIKQIDQDGMAEFKDQLYYSPAVSKLNDLAEEDNDYYENDRYLKFVETKLNFGKWCMLMERVYPKQAGIAIAFSVMSLFKDIVFSVDHNCPLLYCYGPRQSGKSKLAESINALFFHQLLAFNCNSGTDFAFFNRLGRFRNCPSVFNEFDDNDINPRWFQAFKGAYDGEGRERGKEGSLKKTEVQKVHGTVILVGQYLSTRDDNSVLSRSILLEFLKVEQREQQQMEAFSELKDFEQQGITGILIELLKLRPQFEKDYVRLFNQHFSAFRKTAIKLKEKFNERVLRNYTALAASLDIVSQYVEMPINIVEFTQFCFDEILRVSALIEESDILYNFWNMVNYLLVEARILEGHHYKVVKTSHVTIHDEKGKSIQMDLGSVKAIAFFDLNYIHKLYEEAARRQGTDRALSMTNLRTYLKQKKYFLGANKSVKFKLKRLEGPDSIRVTSGYLIDLNRLPFALSIDERGTASLEPEAAKKTSSQLSILGK